MSSYNLRQRKDTEAHQKPGRKNNDRAPMFRDTSEDTEDTIASRTTRVIREQRIREGRPIGYASRKLDEPMRLGAGAILKSADINIETDLIFEMGADCRGDVKTSKNILVQDSFLSGTIECDTLVLKGQGRVEGVVKVRRIFLNDASVFSGDLDVQEIVSRSGDSVLNAQSFNCSGN